MKKIILILFLLVSVVSFAQRNSEMRERIKAQKVAFITEKLNLTTKESQDFWPIYNRFEATNDKIRSEDLREVKMKMRNNPEMSDAEADKLLEQLINAEDKMYKAKIKLLTDLQGVISSKKIIRLKRAEDEFNRKLLERLKEMRQKRGDRN